MNARCMEAGKSKVWLGRIFRSATCAQRIGFTNLEKFLENWRTFRYSRTFYYLWIDLTEQQSWAALRRAANTKFLICSTNSPILIHVTHSARSEVRHNLVICEPGADHDVDEIRLRILSNNPHVTHPFDFRRRNQRQRSQL